MAKALPPEGVLTPMFVDFRVFGVPTRVHAWFLLTVAVVWDLSGGPEAPWASLLIALFLSIQGILGHELGHALVGRAFGLVPEIHLAAFMGVTRWTGGRPPGTWKSILISVAGPLVNLFSGGLIFGASRLLPAEPSRLVAYAIEVGLWLNLGLGIFNLLPVLPLDGGKVMALIFEKVSKDNGLRAAHIVSLVLLGGGIAWALHAGGSVITVMFFGMFAFSNIQGLRAERERRDQPRFSSAEEAVEAAYGALESGDGKRLAALSLMLLGDAEARQDRGALDEALHLLAWARLLLGEPGLAQDAIDSLSGARDADPALAGAIAHALGRNWEAVPLLLRALESGPSAFVEKRLLDAVERDGDFEEVLAFVAKHPDVLSSQSLSTLQSAALAAKLPEAAVSLGEHGSALPQLAFNAACALVRLGRFEEALERLEEARKRGFGDLRLLDEDEDLAPLRLRDDWEQLRARFVE